MVEMIKQKLSDSIESLLDLSFVENNLSVCISRNTFNDAISADLEKIINTIKETVIKADVNFNEIDAIFYTGGSTKIPLIRDKINQLFPQAEIVQGDVFGSVGLGLTIDAKGSMDEALDQTTVKSRAILYWKTLFPYGNSIFYLGTFP